MIRTRRKFLNRSLLATLGTLTGGFFSANCANTIEQKSVDSSPSLASFPLVIATWPNVPASKKAMDILQKGGTALDAVEAGVKVVESDPENQSVGLGGLPDRDGNVTLDACIMDQDGNCGLLQTKIQHIVSSETQTRRFRCHKPPPTSTRRDDYESNRAAGLPDQYFDSKDRNGLLDQKKIKRNKERKGV